MEVLSNFEIRLKVYLTDNIIKADSINEVTNLIDACLIKNKEYRDFHNTNRYKLYTHNSLYPLEKDGVYKAGNIYTIIIRTLDKELYRYFKQKLGDERTRAIKALELESYVLKENHIERIYSITPVIIKTDGGYWRNNLTLKEFEERIKVNLIKKYNILTGNEIDESLPFLNILSFNNNLPIGCDYKNIRLLGDKLDLVIANNKSAQDLVKIAIGTGIGEMNSRGYGFVNYKYI